MCQCPVSGSRLITQRCHLAQRGWQDCVSMPCLGLTSDHMKKIPALIDSSGLCQCPVSGSRLITLHIERTFIMKTLCQCPVSGSRLITEPSSAIATGVEVSMPCLGLTSDHLTVILLENTDVVLCQCPVSGSRLITPPPKIPNVYAAFRLLFF